MIEGTVKRAHFGLLPQEAPVMAVTNAQVLPLSCSYCGRHFRRSCYEQPKDEELHMLVAGLAQTVYLFIQVVMGRHSCSVQLVTQFSCQHIPSEHCPSYTECLCASCLRKQTHHSSHASQATGLSAVQQSLHVYQLLHVNQTLHVHQTLQTQV